MQTRPVLVFYLWCATSPGQTQSLEDFTEADVGRTSHYLRGQRGEKCALFARRYTISNHRCGYSHDKTSGEALQESSSGAAQQARGWGGPEDETRQAEPRDLTAHLPRIGYYIAAPSAKLSLLAKMCHQVRRVEHKKLLIFTDWPVTLWLTGAF